MTDEEAARQAADIARGRRALKSGQARAIIAGAGLSHGEFAALNDVSRITVVRWLSGARTPRPDAARRLVRILDELSR